MPIYDYKCDACGHRFEMNQKMADAPITTCPECKAEKVRKILSTGGIMGSTKGGQDSAPAMPSCATGGCAGGMCGL